MLVCLCVCSFCMFNALVSLTWVAFCLWTCVDQRNHVVINLGKGHFWGIYLGMPRICPQLMYCNQLYQRYLQQRCTLSLPLQLLHVTDAACIRHVVWGLVEWSFDCPPLRLCPVDQQQQRRQAVCCWEPCRQEILINSCRCHAASASAQQQMLVASRWEPTEEAQHRLATNNICWILCFVLCVDSGCTLGERESEISSCLIW